MQPQIREATADDYDHLSALFEEADVKHREHYPRIFRKPAGATRTRQDVEGWLADKTHVLFVAQVQGRLVGMLHAVLNVPSDFPILVPRRYALVENVVVTDGLRRTGIGRALMERAQEWATAEGAESIELNVWQFNHTALEFYQSLGYQTFSQKMAKWLNPDESAD